MTQNIIPPIVNDTDTDGGVQIWLPTVYCAKKSEFSDVVAKIWNRLQQAGSEFQADGAAAENARRTTHKTKGIAIQREFDVKTRRRRRPPIQTRRRHQARLTTRNNGRHSGAAASARCDSKDVHADLSKQTEQQRWNGSRRRLSMVALPRVLYCYAAQRRPPETERNGRAQGTIFKDARGQLSRLPLENLSLNINLKIIKRWPFMTS